MLQFLGKIIDSYVELFQKVYDWFWDHAGIYLGTVMFGAALPILLFDWNRNHTTLGKVAVITWGLMILFWSGRVLWLQANSHYEVHNVVAISSRWVLKLFLWQFVLLFPLLDIMDGNYLEAACHSVVEFIFWGWPYCLMRKRQEKKQKQRVPANPALEGA